MSIEARTASQLPNLLLAHRRQPGRGFFVAAALPLALFALGGLEYGGTGLYALLASICLLQAIYPTLLGWALSVAIYATGSAAYLYALVKDVIDIAGGNQASISADGAGFVLFVILLVAIDVALAIHRPKPLPGA